MSLATVVGRSHSCRASHDGVIRLRTELYLLYRPPTGSALPPPAAASGAVAGHLTCGGGLPGTAAPVALGGLVRDLGGACGLQAEVGNPVCAICRLAGVGDAEPERGHNPGADDHETRLDLTSDVPRPDDSIIEAPTKCGRCRISQRARPPQGNP